VSAKKPTKFLLFNNQPELNFKAQIAEQLNRKKSSLFRLQMPSSFVFFQDFTNIV
jgi:hypothetical protein